jgi:uncharacterized protein (TIGR02145 family)
MKKTFSLLIAALVLLTMVASCSEDDPGKSGTEDPTPELAVDPTSISATAAEGSYAIAITSNVAWTTTKDAEWLLLNPASGEGNGRVTVNVADNGTIAERIANITVTAGELTETVVVRQSPNLPPHAASTQTWVVGEQTWSDHINIPACNKEDFDGGTADSPRADCRNNPEYYYLYSWSYIAQNAETLCPAPWRVPTADDFCTLDKTLNSASSCGTFRQGVGGDTYNAEWGGTYGGFCISNGTVDYGGLYAAYWAATEHSAMYGYFLLYFTDPSGSYVAAQNYESKTYGFLVRCVK